MNTIINHTKTITLIIAIVLETLSAGHHSLQSQPLLQLNL